MSHNSPIRQALASHQAQKANLEASIRSAEAEIANGTLSTAAAEPMIAAWRGHIEAHDHGFFGFRLNRGDTQLMKVEAAHGCPPSSLAARRPPEGMRAGSGAAQRSALLLMRFACDFILA